MDIKDLSFQIYSCINKYEDSNERINHVLDLIAKYFNAKRVVLVELKPTEETPVRSYEWCKGGVCTISDNFSYKIYWHEFAQKQDVWVIDNVYMFVPVHYRQTCIAALGIEASENSPQWTENDKGALKEISTAVTMALIFKQAEDSARRTVRIMRAVLDNMNLLIYVSDIFTCEILFANKTVLDFIGVSGFNEIKGKICWRHIQKNQTGRCGFCKINQLLENCKRNNFEPIKHELQSTIDNQWYYVEDSIIEWIDGRKVHLQCAVEFTEKKLYTQELEQSASHDKLTGILNREWGYKQLKLELQKSKIASLPLTVCFIDVDGLKAVNDTHGHEWGDRFLIEFAQVIKDNIRLTDLFFRWAGDEFCLALPGCNLSQAEKVIEKIDFNFDKINKSGENNYILAMSAGLEEVLPDSELDSHTVISNADRKMYIIKFEKHKRKALTED